MHLKRWITSIVVLPILGFLIIKGGPLLFAVLIAIVSMIALWEYFRLTLASMPETGVGALNVVSLIMSPLIIWSVYQQLIFVVLGFISIHLVFSGFISLLYFKTNPEISRVVSKQVMGVIYISLFLSFLVLIRNTESGLIWIVLLLAVVFSGDTAAYYIGSYLGRHKLALAISPGKTIEGAVGGLVGNVIIGCLIKQFYFPQLSWLLSIVFFLTIGIVGQVGDLFESELKRSANIKDSGTILPGHGGILDRIDALLFVAPVAYLFTEYVL